MGIKISVLMSVYSTKEEYLRKSIESILNQSLCDFELIIFDDAADSPTKEVLASYNDPRIVLISNDINRGLTANLNKGITLARGEFIARMDADDISHRCRLEKCYRYLMDHPEVNILGTYVKRGNRIIKCHPGITCEFRKALFMIENAGPIHPSVMVRKSFLEKNGLFYDEYFKKAQDFELWTRCIDHTDIIIIPEVLLYYRVHNEQISTAQRGGQDSYSDIIKARMIKATGINRETCEIERFIRSRISGETGYDLFKRILCEISDNNQLSRVYERDAVLFVTRWYLFKYIKNNFTGIARLKEMTLFIIKEHGFRFFCSALKIGVE